MIVYKQSHTRDIPTSRWAEYSAAGWTKQAPRPVQSRVVEAEEVINLKPPALVKAADEKADDDAIKQGE